jgi:hypothetical protein
MKIPGFRTFAAVCLLFGPATRPAAAQLISPGELSEAHAELEGIRSCTSCHQLRSKGIDASLCLDCHVPLRSRIAAREGFHVAREATGDCARCHKEHFGRDFGLVRFDTVGFDHAKVGWTPEGAHAALDCRDCHKPPLVRSVEVRTFKGRYGALARTYLGLDTACRSCHGRDDPHGDQFADRSCDACHGQVGWEDPPGFDHVETRYPLTGAHVRASCEGCHPRLPRAGRATAVRRSRMATAGPGRGDLRFTGIAFRDCTSCHEDEHDGAMGATCGGCHVTADWHRIGEETLRDRFDHDARFLLEGAHADLECTVCHGRPARATDIVRIAYRAGTDGRAYPSPVADGCVSCHVDEHDGEFAGLPGGGSCDGCHGQVEWYPARYDVRRHNAESRFRLEGAHLATPCVACHPDPSAAGEPRFRIGSDLSCADCHAPDDPHRGQFAGRSCDDCHAGRTFRVTTFDHDRTRYRLDGAHRDLACDQCHGKEPAPGGGEMTRYRPLGTECTDCHGGGA